MTHEWTASNLHELVKDLPREVWPERLKPRMAVGTNECYSWEQLDSNLWVWAPIRTSDAAERFTGKMVEYLASKRISVIWHSLYKQWWPTDNDEESIWWWNEFGGDAPPTYLHALTSAYNASKEQDK